MDTEALEKMLARGQDNLLLRYGLGGEYARLRQYDKAIPHLQAAVAFDPHHAAAWKLLGRALTESGRPEEARQAYQQGIAAAEAGGHIQAAREMRVFLKRLDKSAG
ncbi:tetratricopeptide repeat protein [Acidiferrobacter thiooxydans]|jgi:Flp pilus assembly protein TadD|uniref:Tetratricopeptide repeat protein n=1 Tax=Acidiferrobacter thiooxydans TaxID=163359 RepID=A0A1C2G3U4_9GAMM|nr:tetratricopeptide repeat protein [Acidiferrobacter thiooxydans]MDA8119957.1 tetratricopeptide repeat protein [Gammaproteobacteria bacterium]MDA8191350.1 tetratricopeptide repeat protein [Gammaproteobacteria bacterium]RCN58348.1 tetratricopeptide repeat protein [Acidiferrobacter thiooxydans]UEN99945.1 tetratricopeptide repeat protein [Acidiferrobacter thiooxydans]